MVSYLEDEILRYFGGVENNNLINKISSQDDEQEPQVYVHSPYFDSSNILDALLPLRDEFTILSLNVQSLNAKFANLLLFLEHLRSHGFEFSCICLQETWLHNDSNLSLLQIKDYVCISQGNFCSSHGGLLIYLNAKFKHKVLNLYTGSDIWEGQFIEINGKSLNKKIILGNIYKPPRGNTIENIQSFINDITPIMNKLGKTKSDAVMLGDFNINLLKINENGHVSDFLDSVIGHSMYPKITLPTRFTDTSGSLIDNIFCKLSQNTIGAASGIYISNISDHLPYFSSIRTKKVNKGPPKFISKRVNNDNALANFYDELSATNIISKLDPGNSPDTNYSILENYITDARNKHLPIKQIKFKKYEHPLKEWITPGILKSTNFRDTLYRDLKATDPSSELHAAKKVNLQTYNRILNKCKREAEKNYYQQKFTNFKDNIKKTWMTIKDILNKSSSKEEMSKQFMIDGKIISERPLVANHFNRFFINVGPQLADKIDQPAGMHYSDYLRSGKELSFKFDPVNATTVRNIINGLKPKTSSGHDGISVKLLKSISSLITDSITFIINQCLETGVFPDRLKLAKVIPLYKKDDPMLLTNYRPISLLPAISKVFERVIYNQIYDHFQNNNLFYESQYGFRSKHSTEMAALEVIDRIIQEIDANQLPITIFLDLSKAFDTLNHDILINKLYHYGIRNNALNLLKSYLTNRKQYVEIENIQSDTELIHTGVPQGSVLGPLLFIIYMNDISLASPLFNTVLFADDTTLQSTLSSFNISQFYPSELINNELDKVCNWLALNKLSLNIKKTKFMIFHSRQRNITNVIPNLSISGTRIECVSQFNFLGLIIDEHLNWKAHMNKISNKISQTTGIMNQLKRVLPTTILKMLYTSLILPHFNYGVLCWGVSCERIFKLQKKAIRIITKSKFNAHTSPLFRNLHLLKIGDIVTLQQLKFYYKHANNQLPVYLQSFPLYPRSEIHQYATRNSSQLQNKRTNTNLAERSLRVQLPILINNTPLHLLSKVNTHSIFGFTYYYKIFTISSYSIECSISNCYVCAT